MILRIYQFYMFDAWIAIYNIVFASLLGCNASIFQKTEASIRTARHNFRIKITRKKSCFTIYWPSIHGSSIFYNGWKILQLSDQLQTREDPLTADKYFVQTAECQPASEMVEFWGEQERSCWNWILWTKDRQVIEGISLLKDYKWYMDASF